MDPSTNNAADSLGERFQVQWRLGHGGSGDVYQAFDTVLERTVAVKVLRPGNPDPQAGERLLREARACARLTHPSIVTVHDVLQLDSGVCIVMEHLPGTSLDMADGGEASRTLEGGIGIIVRILDGLGYAHLQGVVHRDIKPRNVQLLPDGSIKVLDFGVAHITGVDTLTVTGTITGTVHYASPEQLRGDETDARTDVYSAGILAYELLTGRRPFDGDTIGAVVTKVLHERLPEMGGNWTETFPEIEGIIRKATAKAREERPATAEEMRDALRAVLDGMNERARQTELGPLPGAAHARSMHTVETRGAEDPSGTTASTSASATRRGTKAEGAGNNRKRPRPATVLTGAVVAAVVGGLLWTNEWSATEAPEAPPATTADEASDRFLPATGTPTPREDEPEPADETEQQAPTMAVARGLEAIESNTPPRADVVAETRPPEAEPAAEPSETAKGLYYEGVAEPEGDRAPGAGGNAGIRYRVLRREPSGEAAEVDAETTFRSGDRIRFAFEPNVDGFLYVVQRGSTGRWSVLLPHPEINDGRNAVTGFEEVTIPPEGWFRMDDNPGTEQVFVYLSREPIEALPGGTGRVVTAHSADEHTVSVLAGSVRTRDLVFEKEGTPDGSDQVAYVVNHGNAGGAVAWTVELEHR